MLLAVPSGTPWKVLLAKMERLIKKELVSGCPCGCRGDYEITDKGKHWLQVNHIDKSH